jgi:hypothetical protein
MKLKFNEKKFRRDLAKIHGGIEITASRTVNAAVGRARARYNKSLESEYEIKSKRFTLGAAKEFPSTPERKSKPGQLRALRDIRALLVVKKIRGELHYLAKQEFGIEKEGHKSADGFASLPRTDTARKGGTLAGKVAPKFTLKKSPGRSLLFQGRRFGLPGDGLSDAKRWAVLNRNRRRFNVRQPFRFTMRGQTDVYAEVKGKIRIIRFTRKKTQKIKKMPLFHKAFDSISSAEMQRDFNKIGERVIR